MKLALTSVSALAGIEGVVDVRGLGLLVAAELEAGLSAGHVARAALEAGLVVNAVTTTAAATRSFTSRNRDEIDRAVELLATAIASVRDGHDGGVSV